MRIAVAQMQSVAGDVAANLARIDAAAAHAAAAGADLLLTPELGIVGYGAGAALTTTALAAAEMEARLGPVARHRGLTLVVGFPERDGAALYNSTLLTDGAGRSAVYRKSHLWGDYERAIFTPAPAATVMTEVAGLNVAMLICYDVEFPENVRRLARAGADVVLVSTALPHTAAAPFIAHKVVPVRAHENHVFVAYADHHGFDGRFTHAGLSTIAAPDGSILATAPVEGDHVLVADLAPDDFVAARLENDYLGDLVRVSG